MVTKLMKHLMLSAIRRDLRSSGCYRNILGMKYSRSVHIYGNDVGFREGQYNMYFSSMESDFEAVYMLHACMRHEQF